MSTLVKVILGIVIVIVGTIVMLGVAGVFFARSVHVQESGPSNHKTVNIDSPLGHMTLHASNDFDPGRLGIPVYPGAVKTTDNSFASDFEFDAGSLHKDMNAVGAAFLTPDSTDQVQDFYKRHFPEWHTKWENGAFKFEDSHDGRMRVISVKREGEQTRIGVASFGAAAAN